MFWGLSLEVGKQYSQIVEKSFHISMAALSTGNSGKGPVTVMVEVDKACYPICTLQPGKIPQQALDYNFTEGEEVLIYTEGDLIVHLTGYLIDEPSPFNYDESSSSESVATSSDNEQSDIRKKRKKSDSKSSEGEDLGLLISELEGLNEDSENKVGIWLQRSERSKRRKENDEDLSIPLSCLAEMLPDDGSSGGSEDDDWIPGDKRKPKKKLKAGTKEKAKQNQESDGDNEDSDSINTSNKLNSSKSRQKSSKKKINESKMEEGENSDCHKDTSQEGKPNIEQSDVGECREGSVPIRELPGGLIVEELVKGDGKKAKKGRQVSVYYKGCLKKTKKEFDSCLIGKPFQFKLGKGDVIKGLDDGVEGMQIGGKRRLTIPPSLGTLTEVDDSGNISKLERPKTTLANAGRNRLSEESIGQPKNYN